MQFMLFAIIQKMSYFLWTVRYFRQDNMYGMSSFGKITVDSQEERGCRMKSVGVFATSYSTLHRYKKFLEEQVE